MSIPDPIKKFISSQETVKRRIELMRRFSIPLEVNIRITKATNRLYDKEIGLDDLIAEIKKTTALPDETIKKIVLELAGYEFLPVSSYLGDVGAYVRKLGGEPGEFPATRIILRALTPEEIVSETLRENVLPVPAHLDARLREILESFVRGVRSKDDTYHRLTRAEKIGGLSLADADAQKIVDALESKIKSVKIGASPPKPAVAAAPPEIQHEASENEVEPASAPRWGGGGMVAEVPLETNKAVASGPIFVKPVEGKKVIDIPESVINFERQLSASAVRVAGTIGVVVPKNLNNRFMAIVVARLKEARKSAETIEALKRPVLAGGMGFPAEIAQKTVSLLEEELKKNQQTAAEVLKKEKAEFAARQSRETNEREAARRASEEFELNKIYSKLSGQEVHVERVAKPVMNQILNTVKDAPAAPSPMPAQLRAAPSMPIPRPALPPPQEEKLLPGPAPKPLESAEAKMPPSVPVAPPPPRPIRPEIKPPSVVLPAPSVPVKPPSSPEPVLRDIRKVAPKLVGPAEELRDIALNDFRRLSSNPVEACRKINDRLSLLEEQSYDDLAMGVNAWRGSPLNRLYLSILNESMSGAGGITAIIRGRQTGGKETLTEAEFRAIMDFNRHLKA